MGSAMRRRLTLALGALAFLALLAGCSAAGSVDLRAVNDTELAADASRSPDRLADRARESDRSPAAVVRSAIENGSTTVTAVEPPVDEGLPFAVDGAYYDLNWTVVKRQSARAVSLAIDYNGSDPDGSVVAYGDLPAVDRELLDAVLPPRDEPLRPGPEVGTGAVFTDAELNRSMLVGTDTYDVVRYGGERYPVTVEDVRPVTVGTYRYEAARVAANASAYAAQLRRDYAFTLSNLSEAERSVLEEAAGSGGYYAESDDDDAFAAVLDRFRSHAAIERDRASGLWLVRYDGRLYAADLTFGGFLDT
jgi:hypothetical protein